MIGNQKVIEIKKVSKIYKSSKETIAAIKDIDFSMEYGEDVAIIGPSGSGKTTLLQIMGGLSNPSKGEVKIDGVSVNKGSDNKISQFRNKTIGFIFQNIYLQEYFTAKENVMLPMLIAGVPRKKAEIKAIELLEQVGLKNRINHKPSRLSGGEEQRVAIARALANNPKIIMADEPTAKLDAENTDNILNILKKINDSGVSIIVITHDRKVAGHFHKQLFLDHGAIVDRNF
jgi:putative ABC transport system ATP-binding protein